MAQIKKKCFDENGSAISDNISGIHPLALRVSPPSSQPACRSEDIIETGNQLAKYIDRFQQQMKMFMDTQVPYDVSTLSDDDMKNRLKEKVHLLVDGLDVCDRMEKDRVAEMVTYVEKALSIMQDYSQDQVHVMYELRCFHFSSFVHNHLHNNAYTGSGILLCSSTGGVSTMMSAGM